MAKQKFYITTAIDYVNAKPHCGHAFEKTLADALARYKRLIGNNVFLLTGVDENAQKNVEAAQKAGIPVKEFIDRNANYFIELCKKLNISYDDFVRTTAKEHAKEVHKIVQKIIDAEDIYKGTYEGLYCIGCETYYSEKDLIDGKCPEHNTVPELRKEEAYFFRLSKYKNRLLKIIPKYVVPNYRANEVLTRIKGDGLNDICISRKGAKWGIDLPNDKDYKIWVWIDALINYISGLKEKEKTFWPAEVHIIGKGINWFHSVIWPAMLLSAGYKLPNKLLIHGYLNIGGKKMSKSLGNTLDPLELLSKYPSDVVRYSLLKCSVFDDSDYSEEIIIERNNNELANKLGNLISRVSTLAETYGLQKTPIKFLKSEKLKRTVSEYIDNFEFDKALNAIFSFIDECNEFVQKNKPWETKDKKVLYELVNAIKDFSILLSPFIPETSEKIAKTFNFDISIKSLNTALKVSKIKKADILFKKIEVLVKVNNKQLNNNSNSVVKDNKSLINKEKNLTNKEQIDNPKEEKINKSPSIPGIMSNIDYKDWEKIELRVAKIEKAEDIEGADKLYKLTVNLGSEKRTILAGLKKHYKKTELEGKKVIVFTNLAPRVMKGIESQGMLLAAVSEDESQVILISPEKEIKEGSKIR